MGAPVFGLIFVVCVVLLICCRKRIKLFKWFRRTTNPDEPQTHRNQNENRDPENAKDCDDVKKCRTAKPARTPEMIINFEPPKPNDKNVNHFQNSQGEGKEEKEGKQEEREEQEKEERRIEEKERRRKELQERRRNEVKRERGKDKQGIGRTDSMR